MNYEGNEIEYLPSCMLQMTHFEHINVKNNYLHPFFWKNVMKNQVQVNDFEITYIKPTLLNNFNLKKFRF